MAAFTAVAADSADLTVKGTIKPAACKVTLPDTVIDFGTITASSLSKTVAIRLTAKLFSLTIHCDAPTKLALTLIDGRKGTANEAAGNAIIASDGTWYGVGKVDGKTIAAFTIQSNGQTSAAADGENASTLYTTDTSDSWQRTDQIEWTEPGIRTHSWTTRDASAPGAFKTIAQQWQLDLAIGRAGDLPAPVNEVPLSGLVTFQVKYL